MGLPDDTCLILEIDISVFLDLSIDLPGGVSLMAKLEAGELPSLAGIVNSVLGQLNAALTPLAPIFRILDVIIAIVEFNKAIPDSLGPPPDPTKLIKALKKLIKAVAKVTAILPPLSIPIMIVGVCKTIVAALLALIEQLEHMLTVQASLDASRDKAALLALDPIVGAGAAQLELSLDCAQATLDLQLSVSMAGLGPLNRILDLLNLFCDLIGLPQFLKLSATGSIAQILEPLRTAVLALGAICNNIPT